MKMNTQADNRFDAEASKYAAYLETPEGRLRVDLALANLQEFLPQHIGKSFRALDLGCGTGAAGVRVAQLGAQATLLDSSSEMLDLAKRAALNAGLVDLVTFKQGDATEVASLFDVGSFDAVLCHNVVEFVDDPASLLCDIAGLLRGPSAILSVLVRNQTGELLKMALLTGDLDAAEATLNKEWGQESLYGGKVRLFTPESLEGMLRKASLTAAAQRGVRVIADYLPVQISRTAEYERIFGLERQLGARREFAAIARYTHFLARPAELRPEKNQ